MLHEILLSLSGYPSPLLRADSPDFHAHSTLSPPERDLLRTTAHLSDFHIKLRTHIVEISAEHPSTICRAVATAIESTHLAAFRNKVLAVESDILKGDASLVGAYNIVPLTSIVGQFSDWSRRLEWLWNTVQFMLRRSTPNDQRGPGKLCCTGAMLINHLRSEMQTGFADIEKTAIDLVHMAERAWLQQVSAWVLYGRLPSFGCTDFFVHEIDIKGEVDFSIDSSLLPSFVSSSTASSMLFIGRSLTYIRARSAIDSDINGLDHLSLQLIEFSKLTYPLVPAAFARTIASVRHALSRNTLQKLLPLSKVIDILQLLRGFFLLARGEFAMVLTHQADEKLQTRWKRVERLAHDKRDLAPPVVKEGEVSAVLARTWAAMGSLQGQHAEEDEGLELARELIRLTLSKSKSTTPLKLGASVRGGRSGTVGYSTSTIATTPFRNFLFSVPVVLTLEIPSPIDLFLSKADLQTYSAINSYLLSLRRAHIHLTDLWKISTLRRHHPAPPAPPYSSTPAGRSRAKILRERQRGRESVMRVAWATASATVFFLAETEAYLQNEVVDGLWDGFQEWLVAPTKKKAETSRLATNGNLWQKSEIKESSGRNNDKEEQPGQENHQPAHHDPQTLALAHKTYLRALAHHLLLTNSTIMDPLYSLLIQIDQLTARIRQLQDLWNRMDLEADEGVIDTHGIGDEEPEMRRSLVDTSENVRVGIQEVIESLRSVVGENAWSADSGLHARAERQRSETVAVRRYVDSNSEGEDDEDEGDIEDDGRMPEEGEYTPRRVGGVDRLLMKLDFGSWFDEDKKLDDIFGL